MKTKTSITILTISAITTLTAIFSNQKALNTNADEEYNQRWEYFTENVENFYTNTNNLNSERIPNGTNNYFFTYEDNTNRNENYIYVTDTYIGSQFDGTIAMKITDNPIEPFRLKIEQKYINGQPYKTINIRYEIQPYYEYINNDMEGDTLPIIYGSKQISFPQELKFTNNIIYQIERQIYKNNENTLYIEEEERLIFNDYNGIAVKVWYTNYYTITGSSGYWIPFEDTETLTHYRFTFTKEINENYINQMPIYYEDGIDIGEHNVVNNPNEYGLFTSEQYNNLALSKDNFINIPGLMFDILAMPWQFITNAFDVTLFPNTPYEINFANLFKGMIAILTLLFIIKLLTNGVSAIGNIENKKLQNEKLKSETKLNESKIKKNQDD